MPTLDARHIELFLSKGFHDGSWEYSVLGSHDIKKNADGASGLHRVAFLTLYISGIHQHLVSYLMEFGLTYEEVGQLLAFRPELMCCNIEERWKPLVKKLLTNS